MARVRTAASALLLTVLATTAAGLPPPPAVCFHQSLVRKGLGCL
jgi:hypothetical protein